MGGLCLTRPSFPPSLPPSLDAKTILHFSKQQTSQAGRALRRRAPSKEQVATAALVVARTTVTWLDRAVQRMR